MDASSDKPKTISPPYVAYLTFKQTIRGLNRDGHIPDQIDSSILPTMSGSARQQFVNALKFFSLIDDKNVVSATLKNLAQAQDDDKWKPLLQGVINHHYQPQMKALTGGTP